MLSCSLAVRRQPLLAVRQEQSCFPIGPIPMNQSKSLLSLIHQLDTAIEDIECSCNLLRFTLVLEALSAHFSKSVDSGESQPHRVNRMQLQVDIQSFEKTLSSSTQLENNGLGTIVRDAHQLHQALTCHFAGGHGCCEPSS